MKETLISTLVHYILDEAKLAKQSESSTSDAVLSVKQTPSETKAQTCLQRRLPLLLICCQNRMERLTAAVEVINTRAKQKLVLDKNLLFVVMQKFAS